MMTSFWQHVFDDSRDQAVSPSRDGIIAFNEHNIIHFNNAGASPSPKPVLRAVANHLSKEAVLGGYLAASRAQPELDKVYTSVARLVNARCNGYDAREEIALVESATVGWTRIFYSMAETLARQSEVMSAARKERVILISEAEYAANVVAAVKFAREQNERIKSTNVRWRVLSIPSTTYIDNQGEYQTSGVVDLKVLDDMLAGKWKFDDSLLDPMSITMICITHIPTNSGIINPVNEIGERIAAHNKNRSGETSPLSKCLYLVDACQSAGQLILDVQKMHCDALAATGRKYLRGPRGTGFLWVKREIANVLEPSHVDHSSTPVKQIPKMTTSGADETAYLSIDLTEQLVFNHRKGAARFEFWESNIAGKLGLGAAVDYALDEIGIDVIEEKCCYLGDKLRSRLFYIEGIRLHHYGRDGSKQCGIVVFSVENDPCKVKEYLIKSSSKDNLTDCFEVSVVPATSTPIDSAKTRVNDLVRVSLSYFNTEEEINLFCNKMLSIVAK